MVTFAAPVFETETVFEVALPILTLPKLMRVAFAVSVPAAGATAVGTLEETVVELALLDDVGVRLLVTTLFVLEEVVEAEAVGEMDELPPKNKPLTTEFG